MAAILRSGCNGVVRVLFIAPAPPNLPALRWWNELADLTEVEGATVEIIAGASATIDRVAKSLRRGADIIVISGHGAANQILLSDDRRVSGEWIATQARKSPPEAIMVGACFSGQRDDRWLESIGEAISQAGIHAVVFETAVDDDSAAIFSTEFIRAMVAVFDVVRANRVATLSTAQSGAASAAISARLVPGVVNGYREFVRRLDDMDCRMQQLNSGQELILSLLRQQMAVA